MWDKSIEDLGELQRTVLETVWELGQATVHDVRDQIKSQRKLAYTSVLTTLQNLERAGWLKHRTEGRTYVYIPTRSRQQAGVGSVQKLIKSVFAGDALLMFQHLIEEDQLSAQQLKKLRQMIKNKKKGDMRK
jgi:BlaI family transcriptional regulator, penicillinase repressor